MKLKPEVNLLMNQVAEHALALQEALVALPQEYRVEFADSYDALLRIRQVEVLIRVKSLQSDVGTMEEAMVNGATRVLGR